jgi:hypothetical protein
MSPKTDPTIAPDRELEEDTKLDPSDPASAQVALLRELVQVQTADAAGSKQKYVR